MPRALRKEEPLRRHERNSKTDHKAKVSSVATKRPEKLKRGEVASSEKHENKSDRRAGSRLQDKDNVATTGDTENKI